MSQPEWMQKFKQIGLKSQEEVTTSDESGAHKSEEAEAGANERFSRFEKRAQGTTANTNIPEWMKKKSERKIEDFPKPGSRPSTTQAGDDEDAAALFATAGSKPAAVKAADEKEEGEDPAALFAAAGSAPAAAAAPVRGGGLTAEDEEMVTKYKRMFKMGMPEGAVIQKMSVDEVPKHFQDAVLAPAEDPPKESEGPLILTPEEEEMAMKYKKMFKMGMPEGAVIQKMSVDEVPKHVQDAVLAPTEDPPKESEGPLTLSPEDEEMVTKYKKMFKMGMPEGAVVQKMSVDEVPKHVQDAVLAPDSIEETTAEGAVQDENVEEVIAKRTVEQNVVSPSIIQENFPSEMTTNRPEAGAPPLVQSTVEGRGVAAREAPEEQPTTARPAEQKMTDEEFGEPWVIDRDRVLRELNTTRFEEVEVQRDTGNVHYEEVYIDEHGNEVVAPPRERGFFAGHGVVHEEEEEEEEEIMVDEEVDDDDEYEDEFVPRKAAGSVTQEEEVVINAEVEEDKTVQVQEEEVEEPAEPPYDPDYDVENQIKLLNRGTKKYRSRMAPWLPYVFICAVLAAALFILFFVGLGKNKGVNPQSVPTSAPTTTSFTPLVPTNTGAIAVAATTPLDPVTGNCNFTQSVQPNTIDQCACTGSINIIANSIRQRYESLLQTFMPSVIPSFKGNISSCDATNQALIWLSSGVNNAGEAPAFVRRERYVLAYFYIAQGGTGWTDNSNWLSELNACQWSHVTCDQRGRVISLDLSNNGLTGQLSGAVSLLEDLAQFSVARNTVRGSIPSEIFSTPKLRSLDLSSNSLSGNLPPLPDTSMLETINFSLNKLSGNIPSSLGNAGALSSLNFAYNTLSGAVPTELFSLPLLELYLAPNVLNGTIPDSIDRLSTIKSLTLGPNKFVGSIPTTMGNLNNLTQLVIQDVPGLTGRLPAEYGIGLTNLVQFVLTGTSVRGNIPQQFGSMTALQVLNFAQNSLGQALPSELGLMTSLRILQLNNNFFSGTIPSEIENDVSLIDLQLRANQLTGTIPSSIGQLTNLETLTLDGNFLTGRAPAEICNLRNDNLTKLTVGCPQQVNSVLISGIICSIPSCCTQCF